MSKVPFAQRFGFEKSKPVTDDFPQSARLALGYLIEDMARKNFVSYYDVKAELARTARLPAIPQGPGSYFDDSIEILDTMDWKQAYVFCERVYDHLLHELSDVTDDLYISLSEVREYYVNELNAILQEENIAYEFVDGEFHLRGRAQTQKSAQRVGKILGDPILTDVRKHFNKALGFFREFPDPDPENCVKEALCALEACLEVLCDEFASQNFSRGLKRLEGNLDGEIPPPIAQGMIKLHGYRGSGEGVAHAATGGNRVSETEAELVLNLSASYITYLYDLYPPTDEEIPF